MSVDQTPKSDRSGKAAWRARGDVRHSKDDALDAREFELLVESTYDLDGDYFELESRWVVFAAGRYGMRSAEIAHMRADWIDWRRGMIEIPEHQGCEKGKDGGICGTCRNSAESMVAHNEGLSIEEAERMMWSPKTEASAREIPLAASTRARIACERYFDRFDSFQSCVGAVNRRVKRAARSARELDADDVYPHCLRATCATTLANQGVDVLSLQSLMGWEDFSVARNYLQRSGERTEKALQRTEG